jgi:hypothetical protein
MSEGRLNRRRRCSLAVAMLALCIFVLVLVKTIFGKLGHGNRAIPDFQRGKLLNF